MRAIALLMDCRSKPSKPLFEAFMRDVEEYKKMVLGCTFEHNGVYVALDQKTELTTANGSDTKSWTVAIGSPFLANDRSRVLNDVLDQFPFYPEETLEKLEGHFVLVGYNTQEAAVYVAADAVGSLGLYYSVDNDLTYISTSALAIARSLSSVQPDFFAIESFLFTGGLIGNRTLFEQVRRIKGGQLHIFKEGQATVRRWHTFSAHTPQFESLDAASQELSSLVTELIELGDRPRRQVWCQLTAGYDSRVLAACLSNTRVPFHAVVYGPEGHEDVEGARQVSNELGWQCYVQGIPHDWGMQQWNYIEAGVGLTDGHYDILGFIRHLHWDQQIIRQSDRLYSGIAGEMLRDFFWRQEMFRAGKTSDVNLELLIDARILNRAAASLVGQRHLLDEYRGRLLVELEQQINDIPHALNTFKLDLLYLNKIARFGFEYVTASLPYLTVVAPFAFRRVLEYLLNLPPMYRMRTRLIRDMTFRMNPDLARLPTNYGHPMAPIRLRNAHQFIPWLWDDAKRIARKIGQVTAGVAIFPNKTGRHYNEQAWIKDLVQRPEIGDSFRFDDMYTAGLYKSTELKIFIDKAHQGKMPEPGLFGRILAVELAFREVGLTLPAVQP